METEDTGSGKEDEPEPDLNSEQEEEDGSGPSTSSGSNAQSSNRTMRNLAEKMRRDKLNFFINELSTLVPIISFSPKKLDKTSILRLAATYIRLHNVVFGSVRQGKQLNSSIHNQMLEYLPQALASYNWSENVLEEMDGMLMIVNGAGSIIFISHTVERLLGHTQIELMGQSLYNLTCLEDYDELKRNLSSDEDWNSTVNAGDVDESSSDSSCPPPTPPVRPALMPPDSQEKQRRSFFVRLKQRAQSRGDQPQYVLVHIVGHLRVPPRHPQASTSRSTSPPVNHNNITLVAVVKPFQEKRITTLSLMEASREEFITRHTIDGRIIYTDHRISIVAGYLSEEVCGIPGFQYMHKEDMRWTMVGLRQMYYRGSSFGQSCYRLQTKTGNFIYLKTCGYLELSENNESFQSLICINSLVSAEEGEALIQQMKDQYSPVIRNKNDKNMEILGSPIQGQAALKSGIMLEERTKGETENSDVLKEAINHMISNVPTPPPFLNMQSPSPVSSDANDTKIALIKKQMPPVEEQIKRVGINQFLKIPIRVTGMGTSLSSPGSLHSQHSQHSPPMRGSPPSVRPFTPPPTEQQNRPSVLRCATKTKQGDQVSVIKIKRQRTDDSGQDIVTVSPCSVVVSPSSSSASVCGKRKSLDSSEWPMPPLQVDVPTSAPPLTSTQFPLDDLLEVTEVDGDILSSFPIPDDASSPSLAGNLDDIGLADMYSLTWPLGPLELPEVLERTDVLERPGVLESSHRSLDSNLQLQDDQIHKIQHDLELVAPEHTNGSHQVYNTKLSQLQMQKVTKFLQDVYHKMDSCHQKLQEPL